LDEPQEKGNIDVKFPLRNLLLFACSSLMATVFAAAQVTSFEHIVVIVQENRTPDNLFQGLCVKPNSCSITPKGPQYNIQTSNWRDKSQATGVTQPLPVELTAPYDLDHSHRSFLKACNLNTTTGICAMNGSAGVACTGTCPTQPQYRFVDNSTGSLDPYLALATQYGWSNYMFQTNQGPSFPAHQFLFGGTSAPTTPDDALGIFAAENGTSSGGCIATSTTHVTLILPPDNETQSMYPCFEHNTLPDILPANVTWKYYAPNAGSIWTAPDAIHHICEPNQPTGGQCVGPIWVANVDLKPADVLTDISKCNLRNLVWVIPTGQNSDHASINTGGGPSWVASVVNAIGSSGCHNLDGTSYWDSTAILILWDDWGGWYDHEPPTILPQPQGDYQYGFRVPMIFVSAYTKTGLVENTRHDFGSILRFIERNFGVPQGALNFADARAKDSLTGFYSFRLVPRPFVTVAAPKAAAFFLNDKSVPLDPDDD
jgi:phospholipase C